MDPITGLVEWWDRLPAAAVVLARVVGLLVTLPVLGRSNTPLQVKALLALAITAVLVPGAGLDLPGGSANGLGYVVLIIREAAVGMMLGWLVDCFFIGVQFGADLSGRIAGFAAAEVFNPDIGGMQGPIGELFAITFALLFLITDGHHSVLLALAHSYDVLPIGTLALGTNLEPVVAAATGQVFIIGISFAFPVIAVIMAVAMAEGVITRTIPQINILHITFAIKILMFLLIMHLGVPVAVAFLVSVVHAAEQFLAMALPALG
ncbi:MAG: flagellar biosynthetic protein FliR [Planctomycetota bacterium]